MTRLGLLFRLVFEGVPRFALSIFDNFPLLRRRRQRVTRNAAVGTLSPPLI